MTLPVRTRVLATPLVLAGLLAAGCNSGPSGGFLQLQIGTVLQTASAGFDLVLGGKWLVFEADEATTGAGGTDLNGDGDTDDLVTVAFDLASGLSYPLEVTADDAIVLGTFQEVIFLAVEEAVDWTDWNVDGDQLDRVLLAWSEIDPVVRFVDTLRAAPGGLDFARSGGRLYWSSADDPGGADLTSIRFARKANPTTPVPVGAVPGHGEMRQTLLGRESGLLFLGLDETVEGVDENGDADATDAVVLALLDGRDDQAAVASTSLALDPGALVFDAFQGDTDGAYTAAFLVSEAAQGGANLNDPALFDPAWEAAQCVATPDADALDAVLHTLELADLVAGVGAPLNTGLAGRDRVQIAQGHVATLSAEADAGCDLNADGDTDDVVMRWVLAAAPALPAVLPEDLLAVAAVPGGSCGLARLDGNWVIAVDEADDGRDHDGDGELTRVLLAWRDPAVAPWTFLHRDVDPTEVPTMIHVGVDWMAPLPQEDRLPIGFSEESQGTSLNTNCKLLPSDTDLDDTLPAWVRFPFDPTTPDELTVAGLGNALPGTAVDVVLREFAAYYRISEADDGTDPNLDGDFDDVVLVRSSLFACQPSHLGTVPDEAGPAIHAAGDDFAVFVEVESLTGIDWNGDGDATDRVLRFFAI